MVAPLITADADKILDGIILYQLYAGEIEFVEIHAVGNMAALLSDGGFVPWTAAKPMPYHRMPLDRKKELDHTRSVYVRQS